MCCRFLSLNLKSQTVSNIAFSRKIALRYLWSRRSEAFITILTVISILGVAIGVMVLNITMAIMTGFETELREKIVGANSHITVRTVSNRMEEWREAIERITKVPGITSASPFTYNQALLKVDNRSAGILIRGIEEGSPGAEELAGYLTEGKGQIRALYNPPPVEIFDEAGDEAQANLSGIVLGRELTRTHGITTGSIISLLSPHVSSTPLGLVPKFKRFVVSGVYNSGLIEYESGVAYISIADAQSFFKLGNSITGIEVRVADLDRAPLLAKQRLDKLNGKSDNITAQDRTQTN